MKRENVTVLGATGSIGVNTLDVIRRHPDRYRVFALCAHTQIDKLFEQVREFADCALALEQLADDHQPMRMRQRLEKIARLAHRGLHLFWTYIHTCIYTIYHICRQSTPAENSGAS